jgi:hypothetical protein
MPLPGKPTTIAKRFIVDYSCYQTRYRHFGPLDFLQAMQFKSHLQNLGFHTQTSWNGGLVVSYRLPYVRNRFFNTYYEAQNFRAQMMFLGCWTQIRAVSAVPWGVNMLSGGPGLGGQGFVKPGLGGPVVGTSSAAQLFGGHRSR